MEGPSLRLEVSCFDCRYMASERYHYQNDSGFDCYCGYFEERRSLPSYTHKTPEWCPFFPRDVVKVVIEYNLGHDAR